MTSKTTKCKIKFPYLEDYEQAVADGKYVLSKKMEQNFALVKRYLNQGVCFYDHDKATKAISFIEHKLRFVEGKAGRFKLEIWQKYFIACIFGLLDSEGNRQFSEFVLICGRKQGKSALVGALETTVAYTQKELGMQLYNLAPKLQQANIIYKQVLLMIEAEPTLYKRGKKRRVDYYIPSKNCTISPLAFNSKKSDGFNPSFCCFDEFAAWSGARSLDMYNVMLSGQGSRAEPINIACSTANFESEGLYDELYARSIKVLDGESEDTNLLPFIYEIDDITKWDDIHELRKALPNLGVSFLVKNLEKEIRKAHESTVYRKEFITKYCNIKQNAIATWLTEEQIKSTICPKLDIDMFYSMSGVGGVDLSQTTDLTSACIVIRYEDKDYMLSHFWIPGDKIEECSERDNLDYSLMISYGFCSPSGQKFVDYKDVTAWFVEMRDRYGLTVPVVGYDRYSSTYFVDEMKSNGFLMDDVNQGTNLTPILDEFHGMISDGKIRTGNNGLLQLHFRNGAVQFVAGDNRMRLVKSNRDKHIDGLAAVIDAMTVRSKYHDQYSWILFDNKIIKRGS